MNEPDIDVEELKEAVRGAIKQLKAIIEGILDIVFENARKIVETVNELEQTQEHIESTNKEPYMKTELYGPKIYDEDPETLGTGPPNLL